MREIIATIMYLRWHNTGAIRRLSGLINWRQQSALAGCDLQAPALSSISCSAVAAVKMPRGGEGTQSDGHLLYIAMRHRRNVISATSGIILLVS